MEIELTVPYAECYSFEYPKPKLRRRKLYEYVKRCLMEVHPGFNEESLWDFRVVHFENKKVVKAAVINRDFYLEKRLSDRKTVFFTKDSGKNNVELFKRCAFDEKGERRKHRGYLIILFAMFISITGFVIYTVSRTRSRSEVIYETETEEEITDAVNVFDILNYFAQIIEKSGGKAKLVQFNAHPGGRVIFSLYGCEPYSLVCELEKDEKVFECICENVIYSGEEENFEVRIGINLPSVVPDAREERELLMLQNCITQKIREAELMIQASSLENASGSVTVQMECSEEELKKLNELLNYICLEKNLFLSGLSEMRSEGKPEVSVKAEFIALNEKQKVLSEGREEKLSDILFGKKKALSTEKKTLEAKKNLKRENIRKIGMVQKEGKVLYYYRTEEGKIEISEVDYE